MIFCLGIVRLEKHWWEWTIKDFNISISGFTMGLLPSGHKSRHSLRSPHRAWYAALDLADGCSKLQT
jgi:hypothetical protein